MKKWSTKLKKKSYLRTKKHQIKEFSRQPSHTRSNDETTLSTIAIGEKLKCYGRKRGMEVHSIDVL